LCTKRIWTHIKLHYQFCQLLHVIRPIYKALGLRKRILGGWNRSSSISVMTACTKRVAVYMYYKLRFWWKRSRAHYAEIWAGRENAAAAADSSNFATGVRAVPSVGDADKRIKQQCRLDLNILRRDADLVAAIVGGFEVRGWERGGVAGVVR
jgi:hypothetical protein